MTATDDKQKIRHFFKAKRIEISAEKKKQSSEALIKHFQRVRYGVSWLMYAALDNEISLEPLFQFIRTSRKENCYFPRIVGENLQFKRIDQYSDLQAGQFAPEPSGAAEAWDPQRPSMILVPGLAFDRSGGRIGYGEGFYDRFLSEYRQFPRLGVAFESQIANSVLPHEAHDQLMDYVITPSAVWGSSRVLS